MSVTLKIPPGKQSLPCDRDVDTDSVPHVRAYTRVKEFLKQILRDIIEFAGQNLDASNPCHRLVAQLGPNKVVSEFRQQLLAFARQEWPFTDPTPNGDALSWWESLAQNPHARVLAVRKYFSISQIPKIQGLHHCCDRCWRSRYSQIWSIRCLTSVQDQRLHGSTPRYV